jgi:hypothetical protein
MPRPLTHFRILPDSAALTSPGLTAQGATTVSEVGTVCSGRGRTDLVNDPVSDRSSDFKKCREMVEVLYDGGASQGGPGRPVEQLSANGMFFGPQLPTN